MAGFQGNFQVLGVKKLAALLLCAAGIGMTAVAFNSGYTGLAVTGLFVVGAGILLLVIKIVKRS